MTVIHNTAFSTAPYGFSAPSAVYSAQKRIIDFAVKAGEVIEAGDWVILDVSATGEQRGCQVVLAPGNQAIDGNLLPAIGVATAPPTNLDGTDATSASTVSVLVAGYCASAKVTAGVNLGNMLAMNGANGVAGAVVAQADTDPVQPTVGIALADEVDGLATVWVATGFFGV